jgi:hypothetical protein
MLVRTYIEMRQGSKKKVTPTPIGLRSNKKVDTGCGAASAYFRLGMKPFHRRAWIRTYLSTTRRSYRENYSHLSGSGRVFRKPIKMTRYERTSSLLAMQLIREPRLDEGKGA